MIDPAVLLAVDDAQMRAALARLAALAGVAAHTASDGQVRPRWQAAAGVVVDGTAAGWCIEARLPRRPGVLLVVSGDPPAHAWPTAVAVGAEAVLGLPRDERKVLDWIAGVAEPAATGRVVCCIPARGGCGSSTLAAALALAAGGRGQDVLLVDADPCAGGIELLVGIEHVTGSRWDEFMDTAGVVSASGLADALPAVGRVRVMSCSRLSRRSLPPAAVEAVLGAGRRGHGLVVVDTPAAADEVTAYLTAAADTAVVTVAAEVRAVAAATGLVAALTERCADVRLVVRHPGPGGLRPRDVSEAVGAPVAAVWPRDRKVAAMVERGRFSRGWRRTNLAAVTARLLDGLELSAP